MAKETADGRWSWQYKQGGFEHVGDLWLYPELDCSAMVDEHYDESGDAQLRAYVQYIKDRYPHWWEMDAVPIYWSIKGPGTAETAPFQHPDYRQTFLTDFTWPVDRTTGEKIDWFTLPVNNDRFPGFADALGWIPGALQPFAPLRSIMASKAGQVIEGSSTLIYQANTLLQAAKPT